MSISSYQYNNPIGVFFLKINFHKFESDIFVKRTYNVPHVFKKRNPLEFQNTKFPIYRYFIDSDLDMKMYMYM